MVDITRVDTVTTMEAVTTDTTRVAMVDMVGKKCHRHLSLICPRSTRKWCYNDVFMSLPKFIGTQIITIIDNSRIH